MKAKVKSFYHQDTYTWTHLVVCQNTNTAIIIDPVLDYSANNAKTSTEFTDEILDYILMHKIKLNFILETHAHADHITSAAYIQKQLKVKTYIGAGITEVQKTFKNIFNLSADFTVDGIQFSGLLHDNEVLSFGDCQLIALHTPGHTNDSMSYMVGDFVFIGDTLFAPEYGSARCDFPGGNAETLYDSAHKIYALGENKRLYLCHDYPIGDRKPLAWFSSADQQQNNKHLSLAISKSEFVILRKTRDKSLSAPKLIIPAIQVNIAAGHFPKVEDNGICYLKTPINTFGS